MSICFWTIFHSVRIFPPPKPVAPRLSINSKKHVSLLNIDFVKICKRTLKKKRINLLFYVIFLCLLLVWLRLIVVINFIIQQNSQFSKFRDIFISCFNRRTIIFLYNSKKKEIAKSIK